MTIQTRHQIYLKSYSGDSVFLYRFTVFRAFLSRLCHVRFECVTETFLKRKWRFKR